MFSRDCAGTNIDYVSAVVAAAGMNNLVPHA